MRTLDQIYWQSFCTESCGCADLEQALKTHPGLHQMRTGYAGRVVHCRKENYDIYIGRPSKWGNPFSHKLSTVAGVTRVPTRAEALRRFEEYVRSRPDMIQELKELRGKVLGCWCAPGIRPYEVCHGEVLLRLAEEYHR